MEWVVLFFLALSVFLYCLLGGADFGVGIHELFIPEKQKRQHEDIVKEAMGPVWEANHMWLIIVIVILFVGLPKVYSEVSIHLHIPITLMLIGIIFRGCAFTFRHYDPVQDNARKYYSLVFCISSVLTPIAFGMIIGALMLGRIQSAPTDYFSTYVAPWFNLFTLMMGLFVLSIFVFIAGIYMIGEHKIGIFRNDYIRRTKIFHIIMIVMGALVFVSAQLSGYKLIENFLAHPLAVVALVLATLSHAVLWRLFEISSAWRLRFLTGFQIFMVVGAWLALIFPNAIVYNDGTTLSLLSSMAPEKTLAMLGWALIIGSVLFLPLLTYMFLVFKRPETFQKR